MTIRTMLQEFKLPVTFLLKNGESVYHMTSIDKDGIAQGEIYTAMIGVFVRFPMKFDFDDDYEVVDQGE